MANITTEIRGDTHDGQRHNKKAVAAGTTAPRGRDLDCHKATGDESANSNSESDQRCVR